MYLYIYVYYRSLCLLIIVGVVSQAELSKALGYQLRAIYIYAYTYVRIYEAKRKVWMRNRHSSRLGWARLCLAVGQQKLYLD